MADEFKRLRILITKCDELLKQIETKISVYDPVLAREVGQLRHSLKQWRQRNQGDDQLPPSPSRRN